MHIYIYILCKWIENEKNLTFPLLRGSKSEDGTSTFHSIYFFTVWMRMYSITICIIFKTKIRDRQSGVNKCWKPRRTKMRRTRLWIKDTAAGKGPLTLCSYKEAYLVGEAFPIILYLVIFPHFIYFFKSKRTSFSREEESQGLLFL